MRCSVEQEVWMKVWQFCLRKNEEKRKQGQKQRKMKEEEK